MTSTRIIFLFVFAYSRRGLAGRRYEKINVNLAETCYRLHRAVHADLTKPTGGGHIFAGSDSISGYLESYSSHTYIPKGPFRLPIWN